MSISSDSIVAHYGFCVHLTALVYLCVVILVRVSNSMMGTFYLFNYYGAHLRAVCVDRMIKIG